MRAWPSPEVPKLDGFGPAPAVSIFDSASRSLVPLEPEGDARMYVCGITPYDATHVGHAATYTAFDLLQRAWRDAGHAVRYVQNVTDVDDPLLERATATGQDWRELADRETALFREDMTALRVLAPDEYVSAVEAIPLVVELVEQLREKGYVYEVDHDLYFSVHADERFGSVSGLSESEMLAILPERGGDPDRPGKKDPVDCLLWQAERPGEPAWDSALGRGRPGWHVECAAIALRYLGESFDVQGGGSDLVFPHHEMSAVQAQVLTGDWPFARCYSHQAMVGLDGEKMSKSRGNLVLVSRLRADGVDPMAVRLMLLAHHYRTDWFYSDGDLAAAQARLLRWRDAVDRPTGPAADGTLAGVRDLLTDDLDAPHALASVDRWVHDQLTRGGDDPEGPRLVRLLVDALLGVAL